MIDLTAIRRIEDTPASQRVFTLYISQKMGDPDWEFLMQVTGVLTAHHALKALRRAVPGAWAMRHREPLALLPAPPPIGFVPASPDPEGIMLRDRQPVMITGPMLDTAA